MLRRPRKPIRPIPKRTALSPRHAPTGTIRHSVFLLAITTAPTMAARRMRDAISKGSANSVNSAVPIAERLPGEAPPAAGRGAVGASAGSRAYHARRREGQPGGRAQRPMGAESRSRRLARQVEQHEKEQVEHQNGARVHDDLHSRQELRADEQEDARHVQEERENPEHAVDRIAASHGQNRARDAGGRQIVEGLSRKDCHRARVVDFGH